MVRIILWSDEAGQSKSQALAAETEQLSNHSVECLSEAQVKELIEDDASRDEENSQKYLFINGNGELSAQSIQALIEAASSYSGRYGLFEFTNGNAFVSSPEFQQNTIINQLTPSQSWSLAAVIAEEGVMRELGESSSVAEMLLKMGIRSLADDCGETQSTVDTITVEETSEQLETSFTNEICSQLLQFTLGTINIENLFPNHSWEEFAEESAAACYHTIAAKFISLDDIDRARESLQYGDRLEDSPRSLALKGLIALKEGEVLSAVANMVSSLQEYEKRKASDSQHYLSFQPRNLEVINSNLQSGLAALNNRENDAAANYFTDAVFEFDQFFSDCGLEEAKQ